MANVEFRPGQVISVPEEVIRFLPELNPNRRAKKTRHMVVIMDSEPARSFKWEVLLACFIHSDPEALTSWDVRIPQDQTYIPRLDAESWVVIPSLQPLRKEDVVADLGVLGLDIMGEIYASLVRYTGMTDFIGQLD